MKLFYVASYGKHDKKGIYTLKFDEDSLKIKQVQHIVTPDYPSYMITKDHVLYIAYKNASSHEDGGGLGSFSIYKDELVLNNNYSLAVVLIPIYVLMIHKNTSLQQITTLEQLLPYELQNKNIIQKICAVRHRGLGPDLLKRQTSPHAHYVGFTPDKRFLYSVDLGADKVVMYHYNQGVLIEDTDYTLNILPGSGPRHMNSRQDGRFAYLINEIANNIMVYQYNDGRFSLIQSIHCVPRHFKGFSSAAAIRLTASGDHLFVSNRGHDSIAMYRVNKETGKIALLYMVHTDKDPRDFNIIDDKYLIICCQSASKLQVMTFDEQNEKLLLTKSEFEIPSPVCVAFE